MKNLVSPVRALLAAALLAAMPAAKATVLLELAGGYLKDASGTAIASGSGLLLLVASTGDDSFSLITSASSFTIGDLLNEGTDDHMLYRSAIAGDGYMDGSAQSGEFRQVISLTLDSTITEGAALQLYWFPTLTATSTSAVEGTAYGFYRSSVTVGATDADGSSSWFLPADGTSGYTLLFLTSDAGSLVNTNESGIASSVIVAVPEPATWALGAFTLVLAFARRLSRRRPRIVPSTQLVLCGLALGIPWAHAALLTLDNGTVKVGVDTAYGGAITYLSASGSATNLINSHDLGREVQQSYYSGPSDFLPAGAERSPTWNPWPWNPIQSGDAYGNPATILESSNSGGVIYVKTRPMQWALKNVPGDCTFEWWVRLDGPAVRVHCRLVNARADTTQYAIMSQELPAVYGVGTLSRLFSYTGTNPFAGDALTELPAVSPWTQWRATENWSALVDGNNFGFAVHNPDAVLTTGGYAGGGTFGTGGPLDENTSHISMHHFETLDANIVYEYDFNLIVGTLTDIRSWVYAHAADHRPNARFDTGRGHWTSAFGDSGPPAGFLRVTANASNPRIQGPQCAFRASDVSTLYFSARYNLASPPKSPVAKMQWEKNNDGGYPADQSLSVSVTPAGGWRTYSAPVGTAAAWTDLISRLRLVLVQTGSGTDTVDVGGISWQNAPPVVSGLAPSVIVHQDAAVPGLDFTVADDLIPSDSVSATATSSNQALFPDAGLQITTGSGGSRTLQLTPSAGQTGSATITVSASDALLTGSQSFTVQVVSDSPTFDAWRQTLFSSEELAADTLSGPSSDADGDGIPLLAAYAFGSASARVPASNLPAPFVLEAGADRYLAISFIRRRNLSGAILSAEAASSLAGPWDTLDTAQFTSPVDLGDGTERLSVHDNVPISDTNPRFLRLRVTLP